MLRIWIFYDLILTTLIFSTSLTSAHSLTNYLLPLLLLPLLYYLAKELLRKPKKSRLTTHTEFASDVADITKPTLAPAEEGTPLDPNISDQNRRLFLRLVGTSGISLLFLAVLGKGSAKAAFFGSLPGSSSTIAIKDSLGTTIDPAEKQPTDGYSITEVDDSGATSYYGFVHQNGAWYITKEDSTGSYRYAKGSSSFATNWLGRALLTYDYFDAIF